MVCSRFGVRLYAAALRSGPVLLCAAARFVSAKQQGNDGCSRQQGLFLLFLECCGMNSFFGDAELFSPSMIANFSKEFFPYLSTTGHLLSIFYI